MNSLYGNTIFISNINKQTNLMKHIEKEITILNIYK